MSDKLPVISGKDLIRALGSIGFEFLGYGKGDHMKVVRRETKTVLSIPDHRELARGTLKSLIRQAGVTKDQLVDLL